MILRMFMLNNFTWFTESQTETRFWPRSNGS